MLAVILSDLAHLADYLALLTGTHCPLAIPILTTHYVSKPTSTTTP
jgi:hypothetical protein